MTHLPVMPGQAGDAVHSHRVHFCQNTVEGLSTLAVICD